MSTLEAEIAEIIERRFGCHSETAVRAAREIVESSAEFQRLRSENSRLRALLAEAGEVLGPFAAEANRRPWLASPNPLLEATSIGGSSLLNCDLTAARAFIEKLGRVE